MPLPTRDHLRDLKASLVAYLLVKVEAGDFHAVQDAASDIREIEAKLEILRALKEDPR